MPRQDLWDGCYEGDQKDRLSPEAFQQTFCRVCRNEGCNRSVGGQSLWARRMETQVERLINNPSIADPKDPRFAELREMPFLDKFHEALALEISAQRGDWELPTKEDAQRIALEHLRNPAGFQQKDPEYTVLWEGETLGEGGKKYSVTLISSGDKAPVWGCTCLGFHHHQHCKHVDEAKAMYDGAFAEEPEPATPAEQPEVRIVSPEAWKQMRERNLVPKAPNTKFPAEGMMVDGSPIPPPVTSDPWAIPSPVVPVHGKVVMGSAGTPKKEKP